MISLGLDIGTNSVGSAWIDTDAKEICLGVGIFPAGVDERDDKRGTPNNQKRRQSRSQRRSLARRSRRKIAVLRLLIEAGLLPTDSAERQQLFDLNPWTLRAEGLTRSLTPYEFGRVLVHLNQRRGAWGVNVPTVDDDEGSDGDAAKEAEKVKGAISHTRAEMKARSLRTFGELINSVSRERRKPLSGKPDVHYCDPIRNRQGTFDFHAERSMIREEFAILWDTQRRFGGELGARLTDDFRKKFDDPSGDATWRHRGEMFGQRLTYWDTGTLGRCDLEPSDRRCSRADMYAQEFLVLETVNNIQVQKRGDAWRHLDNLESARVVAALREQNGTIPRIRKAIGIDKKNLRAFYKLNLEVDKGRTPNSDWFYREIVHGVWTEPCWLALDDRQRDSVNRALLNFDPDTPEHERELARGARQWWGLSEAQVTTLLEAWRTRPNADRRVNLSRRAIQNLLPYLRRGLSVSEARKQVAEDPNSPASDEQRKRYRLQGSAMSKADRHYLKKHNDSLPPAPMLANPVVRKAIHEVRRHVTAYMRKFGKKPNRIVLEFARAATQPEVVRNAQLAANRKREKEREAIEQEFAAFVKTDNPMHRIVERVKLWREQRKHCAYTGETIGLEAVGYGTDLEIDHIIPLSRSQNNSFNNKVLCLRRANRDKGNQTAREWLAKKNQFVEIETTLAHLEKANPRKWENLHRENVLDTDDPQAMSEWSNSQLTDTAYAARQVAQWLRDVLYGGELDGTKHVYTTKGSYTALLRRDWQLFQRLRDRNAETGRPCEEPGVGQTREEMKDRGDHRHHAIDAVVIALTGPERIQALAQLAAHLEKARAGASTGNWPRRNPLPPPAPWNSVAEFRHDVLSKVFGEFDTMEVDQLGRGRKGNGTEMGRALIVKHRPVKRKIVGALHKEDKWGPVDEREGVFRIRCKVEELNSKMLRLPVPETDAEARARLQRMLCQSGMSDKDAKKRSRELVATSQFHRQLTNPSLGKGGLVRDWELRNIIRQCLKSNGLNPDDFSPKEIKELGSAGKIQMPSGMPIKYVRTIGPISDQARVRIPVRDPLTGRQAINTRTSEPLFRFHISRNNHHMEILQEQSTGAWSGECVTTFVAAQRLRPRKRGVECPISPRRAVNRDDRDGKRFIMSVAEGETLYMRDPDSGQLGYFVVFKLEQPQKIYFVHLWDARPSQEKDGQSKREEIPVTVTKLIELGPEPAVPPYKVRVDSLGIPHRLIRD